jgi:hypothetical protein
LRTEVFEELHSLKKVSEYRDHAEECRTMAKHAASESHREMLLEMASTWDDLAENRERTMASKQRIARLEN